MYRVHCLIGVGLFKKLHLFLIISKVLSFFYYGNKLLSLINLRDKIKKYRYIFSDANHKGNSV